jgi:hypothetical protein
MTPQVRRVACPGLLRRTDHLEMIVSQQFKRFGLNAFEVDKDIVRSHGYLSDA